MDSTIVLGYDGSDGSKAALTATVAIARAFGDRIVVAFGAGVYHIGEDADHKRLVQEMGAAKAEEALTALRAEGFTECEAAVVDARPVEALLHLVETHDARMIVVGTHGEHPLKRAVLGSVPHKLLHASDVPVLVVPA
jgi:nucleotide-binding universal stress UspA family protein